MSHTDPELAEVIRALEGAGLAAEVYDASWRLTAQGDEMNETDRIEAWATGGLVLASKPLVNGSSRPTPRRMELT